jgi:hypothetical protein
MNGDGKRVVIESVPIVQMVEALRRTRPFAETSAEVLKEALARHF